MTRIGGSRHRGPRNAAWMSVNLLRGQLSVGGLERKHVKRASKTTAVVVRLYSVPERTFDPRADLAASLVLAESVRERLYLFRKVFYRGLFRRPPALRKFANNTGTEFSRPAPGRVVATTRCKFRTYAVRIPALAVYVTSSSRDSTRCYSFELITMTEMSPLYLL